MRRFEIGAPSPAADRFKRILHRIDTFTVIDLRIAHHRVLLWIIAVLITVFSAVYQRMTGPSYSLRGSAAVGSPGLSFKLPRTETVGTDVEITLRVPDAAVTGFIRWRRYKSFDDWTTAELRRDGDRLFAHLPRQPPAGKLMYFVYLEQGDRGVSLTGDDPVILRYKGDVPAAILIPHIVLMFLAMLWSNRAMLDALDSRGIARRYMFWTIAFFVPGGFIFGPLVQQAAFGEPWAGVPFGHDLTDNKALIALVAWLWAWYANRGKRNGRGWIFLAALLTLAIFLIPHSLLGSELDYTSLPDAGPG